MQLKPHGWMTYLAGALIAGTGIYGMVTGNMDGFDAMFRAAEGFGLIAARNAGAKLITAVLNRR